MLGRKKQFPIEGDLLAMFISFIQPMGNTASAVTSETCPSLVTGLNYWRGCNWGLEFVGSNHKVEHHLQMLNEWYTYTPEI